MSYYIGTREESWKLHLASKCRSASRNKKESANRIGWTDFSRHKDILYDKLAEFRRGLYPAVGWYRLMLIMIRFSIHGNNSLSYFLFYKYNDVRLIEWQWYVFTGWTTNIKSYEKLGFSIFLTTQFNCANLLNTEVSPSTKDLRSPFRS